MFFVLLLMGFYTETSVADVSDLNTALKNTYIACVNIDDNLHELKVLAGINTAVTAVGTGLGVGATATGFAKTSNDNRIEELEKELKRLSNEYTGLEPTNEEREAFLKEFDEYETLHANDEIKTEIDVLTEKSKKLGNWRTGLMAGNTATNITGAIISSKTVNRDDIQNQIEKCINATKELNNAILVAKLNGEDTSEAKQIYDICHEYEYIDISPINKRGTGAMVSSAIGAGLGGIGTITSGVANTDKIRDDNSDAGKKKEKDLNTTSNVLAVGATAASATAMVFNVTQIATIKKVAKVSESCTGVLK